jgi:hypothetical protein
MPSTSIVRGLRERPAVTMAGLGLLSGILSATIGFDLELSWLRPVAPLFFLDVGPMPIGFFFGAAVAVSLWLWTGTWWTVPVLLVTTMYAWSAAIQVAIRTQRHTGDDPQLIAASLAAGAVGAGLTHLGCALFASGLRRPGRILASCLVGALAGMLFYLGERNYIDPRLLYVVWQPAVAFAIGVGLAGRSQQS